jgi:hypothetical protein
MKAKNAVRRLAYALGHRYRLHRRDLPGTPDLTFPKRGWGQSLVRRRNCSKRRSTHAVVPGRIELPRVVGVRQYGTLVAGTRRPRNHPDLVDGTCVCFALALVLLVAARPALTAPPGQKPNSDSLPMVFGLHSPTEPGSSLSMTCDGAPPYATIVCRFVTVSVRKPSPQQIERDLKELDEAIRKTTATEFLERQQRECGSTPTKHSETVREIESLKARFPASASIAETGLALCRCSGLDCYKQGLRKAMDLQQDVCRASADTFEIEFKRVGQARQWMNAAEPTGLCSMVTAVVIEELDGKWTYRQTRLAVDHTLPLCKGLPPQQELAFIEMLSPGITGCRVVEY